MVDIYSKDLYKTFVDMLPSCLTYDKSLHAFIVAFSRQLQKIIIEYNYNLIYFNIDKLKENALDMLAQDFNVQWYSQQDDIDCKRKIIKNCIKVHRYKGTVYAVKTALNSIYSPVELKEWFEYRGNPYFFRVILDTSNNQNAIDHKELLKQIDMFKRVSAHLEQIIYNSKITLKVFSTTAFNKYTIPLSGTRPYRNYIGKISEDTLDVNAKTKIDTYNLNFAGKTNYSASQFNQEKYELKTNFTISTKKYSIKKCGSKQML